jgi:hypothetical protein
MSERDVVFMVRQGREFEELRYALRSLENLPHGKVWIYGAAPRWLAEAIHVPVPQGAVSHVNTGRMMGVFGLNRALSDEFYWFHDDMYVTDRLNSIPRLWREPWDEWLAGAKQRKDPHGPAKTNATDEILSVFGKPRDYSYELHVPMVVDREALRRMVAEVTAYRPEVLAQVQKRSLYGNWVGYGGTQASDVKFYRSTPVEQLGPLASSSDLALNTPIGQRLRELFSARGRYERPPSTLGGVDKLMAGHLAGGAGG